MLKHEKFKVFLLGMVVAFLLVYVFSGDTSNAQYERNCGRYQMNSIDDDNYYLLDTETGMVWRKQISSDERKCVQITIDLDGKVTKQKTQRP